MPTWVCAMAGIYGCGIQESAYLNMKTRHCISGCGGVKQPCHARLLIPRPSGTPLKGGMAGIYGCGIHGSAHFNIKTRHCISGWVGSSSHVMTMRVGAMAGIYGCDIQESAHLNMKTRHCISGWGRVVLSGLGLTHCHRLRPADNTRDNCSDFYRLLSNLYTSFMVTKFSSTHCIRSSLSQHFMSMVLAKSIAEEE